MSNIHRNGFTDLARLAGAFGIVWFHAKGPGGWIGYAALQMFMALLIHHQLSADRGGPFPAAAGARARRLLGPWVVWSAIFAAAKIADGIVSGTGVAREFAPWMLFTGPALHLWFLPFAFVAGLGALALWRGAPKGRAAFLVGLAALALLQAASLGLPSRGWPIPFPQWLQVLPAVGLGFMICAAEGRGTRLTLLAGLQVGLFALHAATGWPVANDQTLLGAAFAIAAVAVRAPSTEVTRACAGLALTVYLSHPLFAAALGRVWVGASPAEFGLATAACALGFAALVHHMTATVRRPG